jgi:hypothetical protein
MTSIARLDLVVLVADKDMEEGIKAILSNRNESLGIRKLRFEIFRSTLHDPSCFAQSVELLRPFIREANWALVIFDREGSGQEDHSSQEIADDVRNNLRRNGWEDRIIVIIIDPELERWVWSPSNQVALELGWEDIDALKSWLVSQGYWNSDDPKPHRPKEAMQIALRHSQIPWSASIFGKIASRIGLMACQDESFNQLKAFLQSNFPAS